MTTKLVNLTVKGFCEELASSSPAPGGGSASAVAGALGAALASMVGNLTVGKKKYAEVELDMKVLREKANLLKDRYLQLIDEDTEAFNEVMAAFKMPKATQEEKSVRRKAIQEGTKKATATPFEMAKISVDVLKLCKEAALKGNKNALSDAGVGAGMAEAAFRGAVYNVKINLGSLKDEEFVAKMENDLTNLKTEVSELSQQIYKAMDESL
ncbi:cyclodeaminase/cyclohydrolase family protein [Clostridium sp. 'deep sea']|uniref:cyclodeaminase/cyclohydrolase family protein n=1 Tax=Clostridium sp. 'deep sea' TaxID=2779445 RepID=UPI00189649A5|nr:cyclodeaminase/cyclohydrolase family protein [Clostridium sp. 'deep sea']QOR36140.1 cyclodeaminase/cyclohydrolase family protein [Clostridium sp. 'deep sea']